MKQVLIIDDEPIMRKLLEQILKDKYEVISLENGREGLEWMYSGNIPDLVVADLNMPEINGFEYIKKVRESGFFNDVPLIVLSGEESSSERIKCLKLGANDYLIKPFNPEELGLRIDNLISLRS
ncbi:MAG TPA: two-component system response regulator [Cryomorphaceae bacterium]|nr:two-component system response regulator [Owenweeksia sp.]MBF99341.1 two-component system response regulator [Owenweeksia sp.]HAD96809.1 two-component system response regulator [Cryomorphaceae bacterium]HBF21750.1 two-component system response regulator [Cryomorphaceae bacterium]HCQ15957.1 two-component system response regulator [Cryomorphaceae bacterium]|tara:strand:+ start:201 stop:572 length:372 start_codon:yes stop_codon:yes gene_type:complete